MFFLGCTCAPPACLPLLRHCLPLACLLKPRFTSHPLGQLVGRIIIIVPHFLLFCFSASFLGIVHNKCNMAILSIQCKCLDCAEISTSRTTHWSAIYNVIAALDPFHKWRTLSVAASLFYFFTRSSLLNLVHFANFHFHHFHHFQSALRHFRRRALLASCALRGTFWRHANQMMKWWNVQMLFPHNHNREELKIIAH